MASMERTNTDKIFKTITCSEVEYKKQNNSYRWLVNWIVMLSSVFLFSSSLNCLFLWLAYGKGHDLICFFLSLLPAITIYFLTLDARRIPSLNKRLALAIALLLLWAILISATLKLTDFNP